MLGKKMSARISRSALVGSTAIMASLAFAGASYAQDKPADQSAVKEVVVTGSRIVKRDFTSNSPITTVNSQNFEKTSNVAVDATLNKLPQFVPAQNLMGLNSGDIQPTAINTPGIATASLRGLGSNRNLVLVDGRRLTPVNGLNVIDLNTIPSAMIDRVEVITGGASAVYGADAVAGVVNFILKKNFQGLDLDTQYGVSEHGDDREFKASALFGSNFADDKGNVTFGVEHYTRSATLEAKRDFFKKGWGDPTTGTNALFQFTGAQYVPTSTTGGCGSDAAYRSVFGDAPAGSSLGLPSFLESDALCALNAAFAAPVYFNSDGSLFSAGSAVPFNYGAWAAADYKGPITGTSTAYQTVVNSAPTLFGQPAQTVRTIKANTLQNYVLSPLNRWSMFGSAHYDFNENLTFYAQGNFASSESKTRQLPATMIFGWGALIPYNPVTDDPASPGFSPTTGHPVPGALAVLLNSRGFLGSNAAMPWQLNLVPDPNNSWLPARTTDNRNTNWQITAGLKGNLPFKDWTFDLNGSHGETLLYTQADGNLSLGRYREIVTAPGWGLGFNAKGNQYPPLASGFGAGQGTCTSGLYNAVFFNVAPSQDCIDSMVVKLQSASLVSQDVVEYDMQGALFDLPAGQVRASFGADYRSDSLNYTPDPLQEEHSFTDQVGGLYPAAKVDAMVDVKEGYGELLVPILKDLPGVKALNLELGGRYSSYSNSGAGWTYKALGDWSITDWLRLRGGYNLAVRAPTVAESFLGLQEVFGVGSAYGDPCSLTTNAPYGAAGAIPDAGDPTPPGYVPSPAPTRIQQSAFEICKAKMSAAGKNQFYANPQPSNFALPFGWQNQLGNPNLQPEKAHTWTAGIVLRSPMQNPWLERSSLSVDWYKIKINGAIGFQNPDDVNASCFGQDVMDAAGTAVDPVKLAAAVASQPCQASVRVQTTGGSDLTTVSYANLGKLETSGIDVQLNWGISFEQVGASSIPGAINVNVLFNWLDYFKTNSGRPNAYDINWAGTLGPAAGLGVNAGAYKYKINTTLTYTLGPGSLSFNWRHLPSVHAVSYINAAATTTANPTGYLSATNTFLDTPAYNVFDLAASYDISRTYSLRAGIDNLLDADPANTGATFLPSPLPPGTFPFVPSSGAGTTNGALYDAIGRRFYVGVRARF